jgi:tRNA dimethylallyltransferase
MMIGESHRPIYIAGPTACGKSAVAVELAKRLGGEIITVDSMQVYRGLNIGTAKPTSREQEGVPHHLIDVIDLKESFDAAKYIALARVVEKAIRDRNRTPIFCGGTGMYFKALFHGVGTAPSPDPNLRQALEAAPLDELLDELERLDPETFAKIDRENPRRVVRAVEAIRLGGKPFSEQQASWDETPAPPQNFFALSRAPEDLRERIDARVEKMLSDGLLQETEALMHAGLDKNRTAMQAIGYRQMVEHLRGERSLRDTVELIKSKTWQLARRQMTWLRNQLQPKWVAIPHNATPESVAEVVANRCTLQT